MYNRKVITQWYDDLGNHMKQLVPKEKPGGTNPKMNNPLLDGDL